MTTYTVQEGDTLIGIALRFQMKVSDLKYINHIFGSDIFNGQILQLDPIVKRSRSKSLPSPEVESGSDASAIELTPVKKPTPTATDDLATSSQSSSDPTSQELLKETLGEEAFLAMTRPKLLGGSTAEILTDEWYKTNLVPELEQSLARHNRGYDWKLLYSLAQHGASIGTLYQKTYKKAPTILVVETTKRDVFGAFASRPWHSCPDMLASYYGSGECFIFTTTPKYKAYSWTKANSMFMFANDDSIAIGGDGGFGIYLNSDLSKGSSSPCKTFDNPCLASEEDFDIFQVEVWGMVPKR